MAEFVRIDAVLNLVPPVEEMSVEVLVHDTLIVTNAVVTMGAVSISVTKRTRDVPVHAFQDIDSVELHALVSEY